MKKEFLVDEDCKNSRMTEEISNGLKCPEVGMDSPCVPCVEECQGEEFDAIKTASQWSDVAGRIVPA